MLIFVGYFVGYIVGYVELLKRFSHFPESAPMRSNAVAAGWRRKNLRH
jgi:hypothetical protein